MECKWIPVSERLPDVHCIACDAHGNNYPFISHGHYVIKDREHGTWVIDARHGRASFLDGEEGDTLIWENRIVAWMPLPEPYTEDKR